MKKTVKKSSNNACKMAAYGQRDIKIDLTSDKGKFKSLRGLLDTLHVSFKLNFGLAVKKTGTDIAVFFTHSREPDQFTRKKAMNLLKRKMRNNEAIVIYSVHQFYTKAELKNMTSNQVVREIFDRLKKNILKNVGDNTWGLADGNKISYEVCLNDIVRGVSQMVVGNRN